MTQIGYDLLAPPGSAPTNNPTFTGTVIVSGNAAITGALDVDGIAANPITSGALPTIAFASGTAAQVSSTRDVFLTQSVTTTLLAGTCKVEISPDNVTFSTLITQAAGIAGAVEAVSLAVPAGWYVKLTLTNCTFTANGTYY